MRKFLVLFFVGLTAIVNAQQSETRNIGTFKGIKVSEGIDVFLKKGDKEAVRIEVTGVKAEDVVTELSGDYLKIHMQEGRYRDRTVKVYVTYVAINKLSASSASNIFNEGVINANQLAVSASSAGTIDIEVDVEDLEVNASSAADVELRGRAKNLVIDVSSAGEVDAYDLAAEVVDVKVSSAGSAKVSTEKEINAKASSGGSVRYKGSPPRSNTTSSSGGSVKKAN